MCNLDFGDFRVPPWRPDGSADAVDLNNHCLKCGGGNSGNYEKKRKYRIPHSVCVECPYIRQADDVREYHTNPRRLTWIKWLILVSIFMAPLLGSAQGKVCQSVDIRNTPEGLKNLTDCEVVEGFVQILLIENANSSDYANYSFPKLREIADYLLLYRAFNLTTLAGMFPNLSVIRGQNLFSSYSLVIWEMHEMKEIGLHSLKDILRGSVRIEKNDNLCFTNTIDWDLIASAGRGGHVIKDNKDANSCPACPATCPTSHDVKKPLCWNHQKCQEKPSCGEGNRLCFCVKNCDKPDKEKIWEPCDRECAGGCYGRYNDQCFACKHIFDRDKCVRSCPVGTYLYRNRRCVNMTECINMPESKCGKLGEYKPFNRTCIRDCPVGYQEKMETDSFNRPYKTCTQCNDTCPKICGGQNVKDLAVIQALRGCTTIDGALEININGANNIVAELEANLKHIEVVRDYVKIVRSYPLIDLDFLKNLKEIGGVNLENGNALVVRDNENLQDLFGNNTKLRILRGKLSFSFNARLCHRKIIELSTQLGMGIPSDSDVSRFTNGQKASCHNEELVINIEQISEYLVHFRIKNFRKYARVPDHRQLLGYEYHYRETPSQNLSIFGGRDACGNDGWNTGEIKPGSDIDADWDYGLISHLKPFTLYGMYFNTLMVPDESYFTRDYLNDTQSSGATSQILYFRTASGEPNPPLALNVVANTSSDIYITWKVPPIPNANITFYYVHVEINRDDGYQLAERNYCERKLEASVPSEKKPPVEGNVVTRSGEQCCSCVSSGRQLNLREEEGSQKDSIDFENDLHNSVYVKRDDRDECDETDELPTQRARRALHRYRREVNELPLELPELPDFSRFGGSTKQNWVPPAIDATTSTTDLGEVQEYEARINGTSLDIKNLIHFGNYRVTVRACRGDEEYKNAVNRGSSEAQCSIAQYETVRTKPREDADSIDNATVQIHVDTNGTRTVIIKWMRPKNPNGLIVSYNIEFKRPTGFTHTECIPVKERKEDLQESYVVTVDQAGIWKFRLWATSLSGDGYKTIFFEREITDPPSEHMAWIVSCLVIGGVAIILLAVAYRWKKKKSDIPKDVIASFNPDYLSYASADLYIPDDYEVPREHIKFVRELGQGSFGMVYEGVITGMLRSGPVEELRCAIKTVNEGASVRERIEFLNEASVMKAFSCNHVVKLLGVVSIKQPTLVLMELMAHGDLKSYLRSLRPENNTGSDSSLRPPTLKFILKMAIEIADGMAYLSAKKYVHRDLAARNCMVEENLTVKIGDFGMTRDIYETDYYRKGGKGLLPVRWMSPESLKDGVFTSQSDIWSFGVVLWEMATLASQPYQGLSNEQVLKYVMDGGKMEMPEDCPDILYNLMLQCWKFQPKQRPRFVDIVEQLLPELECDNNFSEDSFYHSGEGQEYLALDRQERMVIHEHPEEDNYGNTSFSRTTVPDQTVVEILDVECPDDDDVVLSESHDEEEPLNPCAAS
ncbi:insulin-like peptide receptor isoform X2 [Artemia franciscana]|uniref:insulin-like peptide receptor isoform X2 n=1 Tax=Artemia franciscana TaxID=6661 RepID=UPI0032D9FC71